MTDGPQYERTPASDIGPAELDELLGLAERVARTAGDLAHAGRLAATGSHPGFDDKSSPTDLVTEFDRAAERSIVTELERVRPADGIVAEEGSERPSASGVVWYIDPIDGTTNFVYGLPSWSTSVAAAVGSTVVAAAVYAPVSDEMFTAALGRGARLNGRPIDCRSGGRPLAQCLVATGFTYRADRRAAQAAVVRELLPRVGDIRRIGSAALDLCLVACGRVDAYFERHLNVWDMAGGALVAREAGAITTDLVGDAPDADMIVAAPPRVHGELLALLAHLHTPMSTEHDSDRA